MNDLPDRTWVDTVRFGLTLTVIVMAVAAGLCVAIEYGFEPEARPLPLRLLVGVQVAAVLLFVARSLFGLAVARRPLDYLRTHRLQWIVIALGAIALLIGSELTQRPTTLYIVTVQVVLLVELLYHLSLVNVFLARHHPARLMVGSFVAAIVIGTLLLSLPRASRPHRIGQSVSTPRHVLNCAFTAVSATCVTGLIVYDTPTEFTLFGQVVILVLMQIGGLGIMIFAAVFGLLLRRRMTLGETVMLQGVLSRQQAAGQIARVLTFVVVLTFVIEAIGTAMLYPMWDADVGPAWRRLFHSVFHAVSAFCNAGFSLQTESLVPYSGAWQVYGVMMTLIVLGGLGFPVLGDLIETALARFTAYMRRGHPAAFSTRADRLSLNTKIVLATTVLLIVVGAGLLYFFETPSAVNARYPSDLREPLQPKPPLLAGETWPKRALGALFQSVTTRTAGFNTVPTTTSALSPASHFLMILLMFIGGSPGSTAGGIKTTTLAMVLLASYATLRRRADTEVSGRRVPPELIARAGAVLVLMFGLVAVTTLLLTFSDGENARFLELLFEAVSACGTVGLSCGITSELTAFGRVVIMGAMFVGRLGPLTLFIALAGRQQTARYRYPEETLLIG